MGAIKTARSFAAIKFQLIRFKKTYVVYDKNAKDYAFNIASSEADCFEINADERHKTMDSVVEICKWLISKNADKKAVLLAVGGGVTTDIVGFAASIYKRGIRYVNIPTTLLAMVDASVGGKTGVNLEEFKNMIGTFHKPEFTIIDTDFLKTLPERELLSGVAEILKTFLVHDKFNYEKAFCLLRGPYEFRDLEPIIKKTAKTKLRIVKKDLFDNGRRRILNLGHTYAHAIEWWQQKNNTAHPYTHGEAVAIGIIKAAELSETKGYAKPGLAAVLKADFEACKLPTQLPCGEDDLQEAIHNDKKISDGVQNFVFLKAIGKPKIAKL